MDVLQTLVVGLPFLLFAILTVYYVVLTRQKGWSNSPIDFKIQQCLAPLPVAVGLIAAIIGLMATRYATSTAQRGDTERDRARAVEQTAQQANDLYASVLVELDRVYLAARLLKTTHDPVLQGIQELARDREEETLDDYVQIIISSLDDELLATEATAHLLADRLSSLTDLIYRIISDPFANACYHDRRAAIENELWGTSIINGLRTIGRSLEDAVQTHTLSGAAALLDVTVWKLRDFDAGNGTIFSDDTVRPTTRVSKNLPHRAGLGVRSIVFFGNYVLYVDDVAFSAYHGVAILRDLWRSVPRPDHVADCVARYFPRDEEAATTGET